MIEHAAAAILASPGIGKTSAVYAAFKVLKKQGLATKMLVIAPLRPAQLVWGQEASKWTDFKDLRVELLHGPKKAEALYREADVYVINPDGLDWLLGVRRATGLSGKVCVEVDLKAFKKLGFDTLVIDELTQFKNTNAGRFKALKAVRETFSRIWGLTGTPAPNGLVDLFGQALILDGGRSFGPYVTHFRRDYFTPGYDGFSWVLQKGAEARIYERLRPLALRLDANDYIDMPALVENRLSFTLPSDVRKIYDRMEDDYIAEIGANVITAPNAAAASTKLRQVVNGGVYVDDLADYGKRRVAISGGRRWALLHDEKTELLAELIEELQGTPLLCFYEFHHDAARIKARFPDAPDFSGATAKRALEIEASWNAGEIPLLLGHPACLHPETLVLTEFRGWVKIVEIKVSERVFDGCEFVSHDGCVLSGIMPTIRKFGIICTPNHLFYVNGAWVKAENVPDSKSAFREARYIYEGDDPCVGEMLPLQNGSNPVAAKRHSQQSAGVPPLLNLHFRDSTPHDAHPPLSHLARDNHPNILVRGRRLLSLRGPWDYASCRVAEFQKFLARHAKRIFGQSHDRSDRQRKGVFSRKLPVGDCGRTAIEQTYYACGAVPRTIYALSRFLPYSESKPGGYNAVFKQGANWGCGNGRVSEIDISGAAQKPEEVFDLVNCGPRRRFVVRNPDGDMFIVHNSIGHGLNLQGAGNHVCWYSLPWARDLYDQGCGRVRRQGSRHQTVFAHHLVAAGTIDEAVYYALRGKAKVQDALLAALKGKRR